MMEHLRFIIHTVIPVGITVADSNKKLAAGTYDIPVRITDSNGKTGQGTLKVIVTASVKVVTKVNNNSPDGTIYFYNHNSNEEFSLKYRKRVNIVVV